MKFVLIVAKGKRRGLPIPIHTDLFLVGTSQSCQLRADHPDLGSQHCAFIIRRPKVFLHDLGSGCSTVVNDKIIPPDEEWPLHKGDRIKIGPLEFVMSLHEKALSKRDMEDWALRTLDEDTGQKKSALQILAETFDDEYQVQDDAANAAKAALDKLNMLKGINRGRLRISRLGPITLVKVGETYLVEGPELRHLSNELHDNLDMPDLKVLLDLKHVRRMSSAAASMMAELAGWLQSRGGTLAISRLRPELASMVMQLSSIYDLKMFKDNDHALRSKW